MRFLPNAADKLDDVTSTTAPLQIFTEGFWHTAYIRTGGAFMARAAGEGILS